jgi:hypothetical protein
MQTILLSVLLAVRKLQLRQSALLCFQEIVHQRVDLRQRTHRRRQPVKQHGYGIKIMIGVVLRTCDTHLHSYQA